MLSKFVTVRRTLPTPEKATKLGYGLFRLREYSIRSDNLPGSTEHPGCNVCVVTLKCGTQLIGKYLKDSPDLHCFKNIPSKRVEIKRLDPLQHLISNVRDLSVLHFYQSKIDSNVFC